MAGAREQCRRAGARDGARFVDIWRERLNVRPAEAKAERPECLAKVDDAQHRGRMWSWQGWGIQGGGSWPYPTKLTSSWAVGGETTADAAMRSEATSPPPTMRPSNPGEAAGASCQERVPLTWGVPSQVRSIWSWLLSPGLYCVPVDPRPSPITPCDRNGRITSHPVGARAPDHNPSCSRTSGSGGRDQPF